MAATWRVEQHDGAGWVRLGAWLYETRSEALDYARRIDSHRTPAQREAHPLRVVTVRQGPPDAVVGELMADSAESLGLGHEAEGWRW